MNNEHRLICNDNANVEVDIDLDENLNEIIIDESIISIEVVKIWTDLSGIELIVIGFIKIRKDIDAVDY